MAFGRKKDTSTEPENRTARFFRTMEIDTQLGAKRVIRLLPDWSDPEFPEAGVSSYFVWLPVVVGGNESKRRVYIDKATKQNVLPEFLKMKALYRTFMNVYDLSQTFVTATDENDPSAVQLAYVAGDGKFYKGYNEKKELIPNAKGTPNNRVMVLVAGVALQNALEGQTEILEDDAGNPVNLLDMTFTFVPRLDDNKKPMTAVSAVQYTGKRDYYDLPRYDLDIYKPWPADAIQEILDKRDFNEVVNEYKINTTVKMITKESEEEEIPF